MQYDDGPDSTLQGVWRTRQGETESDSNWREFIGCGLILILESFPDRLPPDLVRDMQAALLRTAQGAAQRNVGAGYTNIALMSALLLDYVGTQQRRVDLQQVGREKAEAIYGPIFAMLRPQVPEEVLPQLRTFAGPRRFERTFGETRVTVLIEKNRMMGAAALKRRWDQHHPATIYWLAGPQQPVGWILLTGLNDGVVPQVADSCLEIRRESKSDQPIQFLIAAPGLDAAAVERDQWRLPGLWVTVETAEGVTLDSVRWIDHPRYDRCLEVRYATGAAMPMGTRALVLRPER